MISTRLKMSEEGLLWRTALEYFGPTGLHEVVVEKWMTARPPTRTTVEYLDSDHVGDEVLNILKIAQIAVGVVVRFRPIEPMRVSIYSAHAEHLASELLQAIPVRKLPASLKGFRLEAELGM